MILTIKSQSRIDEIQVEYGENLMDCIIRGGYFLAAPCGGRGKCGKCRVKILSDKIDEKDIIKGEDGDYVLSCTTTIKSDLSIALTESEGGGLTESIENTLKSGGEGFGIALDIGTTTLAFYLVDLENGKVVNQISMLNPQGSHGADVISRIKASSEGKLGILHNLIIKAVAGGIDKLKTTGNVKKINKLMVAANTTMLHLFVGADPSPMGKVPFTPAFLNRMVLRGSDLALDVEAVILFPSISAYVGGDIVAGILSVNLHEEDGAILVDIGTNGEMAINAGGEIFCCSTAAGPAFEGANISSGSGGVANAINSVAFDGETLKTTTISGEAKTICGCGLIDAVSVMVKEGIIDETGAFDEHYKGKLVECVRDGKFFITPLVSLTKADIREVQLAKSAIAAGLKTLISYAKLTFDKITKLYIAGGLGFYINKQSAVDIGLLPKELLEKIVVVGNSSGDGAKKALCDESVLSQSEIIQHKCKTIDLSNNPTFMDEYIENMFF